MKIWGSRASSHSSYYTVVANCASKKHAKELLRKLPKILTEYQNEMEYSGYESMSSYAIVQGKQLKFCGHYSEGCEPSFLEKALELEGVQRTRIEEDGDTFQVLRFLIPVSPTNASAKTALFALAMANGSYLPIVKNSKKVRFVKIKGKRYIEAIAVCDSWTYSEITKSFFGDEFSPLNPLLGVRFRVEPIQRIRWNQKGRFSW